jgi:uncharacterized membrane protein YfcA
MEILGYLASVVMGISLGMIGGGGSILTVPILVYLFGVGPVLATAYSLFIVGLTALFGGIFYLRRGDVDIKTGIIFAIPSFVGVYATRAWVVPSLPPEILNIGGFVLTKPLLIMLVFSVLMVAASFSMIRSKASNVQPAHLGFIKRTLLIGTEGLVVGAITGFVGAGGGFLIIPALVVLVGLPMKIAVGTSLFIIASKSLLGFVGDLQQHVEIDWFLLASIASIAVVGLIFGMKMSSVISDRALKKGFGWFVLVMGSVILVDQLRSL